MYRSSGQIDSPESRETPKSTEMTENFTKVTKKLTKLKETLINYVWKNLTSKSSKDKISLDSAFSNMLYGKKRKLGNPGNQQTVF